MQIVRPVNKEKTSVLLSPNEEDASHYAPTGTRLYEGAKVTRVDSDLGDFGEINQNIYESLEIMRRRSRALAINDNYITKFSHTCVTETLGPKGLKLKVKGPDENVNNIIEGLYEEWAEAKNCCTSGNVTMFGLEQLAVRTRHIDGEFFCRIVKNFEHNDFKFAIFPFDADRLQLGWNVMPRADGSYILNSIEYDKWARPLAYHILERHPGDNVARWPEGNHRIRIPADEIIHFFEPLRPGQGRGIPSTHSVIVSAKHLNAYIKATIVAMRVNSSKFGAITQKEKDPYKSNLGTVNKDTGEVINQVEAGRMYRLGPGEDVTFFDPKHPGGEFDPFTKMMLQGESSGLQMPYASLSGNLAGTSFASGRLGALENDMNWGLRKTNYVDIFKMPMYRPWLKWAFLTQDELFNAVSAKDLHLYAKSKNVEVFDKPAIWIDPDKMSKVIERNLKMGMTTLHKELAKLNIDYDEHIKEWISEQKDIGTAFKILLEKKNIENGNQEKPEDGDETQKRLSVITNK